VVYSTLVFQIPTCTKPFNVRYNMVKSSWLRKGCTRAKKFNSGVHALTCLYIIYF
jgi:hypothetical protein